MYTLGIDIGGTFTDFALVDESSGTVRVEKEPTTPDNPAIGALRGTRRLIETAEVGLSEIETVIHGTTLVSNTLIEKTGAKTGLVTTDGIRDALALRRGGRYDMFDWDIEYPDPLVPRHRRIVVDERLDPDGTVREPLDEDAARRAVETLIEEHEVEAIAISLLHAYANDAHERLLERLVRETTPDISVCRSSTVAPVIREYERTSTTVINAYTMPVVDEYLGFLTDELADAGFEGAVYLMTSSGGIVDAETAANEPIRLVESGPAAGVLASREVARRHGCTDVFTFDMGGTTAKGSIVQEGTVPTTNATDVAREHRFKDGSGYDLLAPLIDLTEIGAGGGSIAAVSDVGLVEVGPESAGAEPGPVCYNRGGESPTVTDAALLLGYLDPAAFHGGRMDLATERTRAVVERQVAEPLDTSVEAAAWQVFEVVTENMATAFRRYAASRGIDTRGLAMVAIGGAGPTQAFRVARKLDIDRVICPFGAGVGSSVGLTQAPRAYQASASRQAELDALDRETMREQFATLRSEAETVLERAGVEPGSTVAHASLDMRHVNQGHEIEVPLETGVDEVTPEAAEATFERTYEALFDRDTLPYPTEVLTYRLELREPDTKPDARLTPTQTDRRPDSRAVRFGEETLTANVHWWPALEAGQSIDGPAIIEADETTIVVDPDASATVDETQDITISL